MAEDTVLFLTFGLLKYSHRPNITLKNHYVVSILAFWLRLDEVWRCFIGSGAFKSVLNPDNNMNKTIQFSLQFFYMWFAFAFFLGQRQSDQPKITQLVSVPKSRLELRDNWFLT